MEEEYNNGPDQVIPTENRCTTEVKGVVKIRTPNDAAADTKPISVITLMRNTAERWPDRDALCVKRQGQWERISFAQYYTLTRTAAKAFLKLGLEPFGSVAIMGFNAPEYFIANMAAIFAGGVSTGMYTTSSAATCQFYLNNTSVSIVVVENDKYLQRVLSVRHNCPNVRTIVQYSGKPTVDGVLSWEEFLTLGESCDDADLERRQKGIAVNQCASIIYTSGTVGEPKGVMISHDIFTWTAVVGARCFDFRDGQDLLVSYLPLCHGAAQIVDMYAALNTACTIYFAQPDALKGSLIETLKEVRPTLFLGVPRIWEKMYEKFTATLSAGGLKVALLNWCRAQAAHYWRLKQKDPDTPATWGLTMADLVLSRVREQIGLGRTHSAVSSAAPVSIEVLEFVHSLNIPVYELYGLSETCGPSTINNHKGFKVGSIGRVFDGCEVKIQDPDEHGNGEILHWGRNVFMGYVNREDATREALDDADWLHTGDVARIDEDGYLYITGRIKELLITAAGKNVAPTPIEEAIKSELPIVSSVMVVGDRRKFLSALLTFKVVMDPDTGGATDQLVPSVTRWLSERHVQAKSVPEALTQLEKYKSEIQRCIDAANEKAESHACFVQKWCLLDTEFSIPGGELGPTLKLRRRVVLDKYREHIEKLYS